MDRRSLLKALAAIPLLNVMSACNSDNKGRYQDKGDGGKNPDKPTAHRLQILLDGAFAVVVQKDKGDSILAFSPRDKDEPHQFYFNDPFNAQSPKQNYTFELSPEGLKRIERLEPTAVAAGFADFTADVKHWKLTENLITLKLPAPKTISFGGHRERVVFASGKTGWMPTNHILEYEVEDPKQIKIVCKEIEKECTASPDSPEGLTRFFFEVGPPKGTPHVHAINFFNYMLKTSFPELVTDFSLVEILDNPNNDGRYKRAQLVAPVLTESTMPAHLQNASYTLDCKVGGILVKAPTGPLQG
jgi:hypothetical protein